MANGSLRDLWLVGCQLAESSHRVIAVSLEIPVNAIIIMNNAQVACLERAHEKFLKEDPEVPGATTFVVGLEAGQLFKGLLHDAHVVLHVRASTRRQRKASSRMKTNFP